VPGNVNGGSAMRLTSFGNEMLKAASQAANIPSPLSSPSLLSLSPSLQLRRAERGITVCLDGVPAVKVNSLPKRYAESDIKTTMPQN